MRIRPLPAALTFTLALGASTLTACTATADTPSFVEQACPDDVEVQVVPRHGCGIVTVGGSQPQKIFVVIVEPPTPTDRPPVLETGVDLGMTPSYGGLAPIAQRTGRRLVIVDLPGTGHSTPSLDCPEVENLGDAAGIDDPGRIASAVAVCRARLQRDGADIAALTPRRLGASLVAVMRALNEPRWVVMGHGTTAEAGRQAALAHPELVEAFVADSPVADPGLSLTPLIRKIAVQCRTDATCRRRHGDPLRLWRAALRDLDRRPLHVDVPGATVRMTGVTLERGVRWLTGPVDGAADLPAFLDEVAARRPGPHLQLLAATLSVAPPLCVGYVPKCQTDERLVIGATLSAQCPTAAHLPAWSAVCRAWGVPHEPVAPRPLTGVPALALTGALDPFATPALADAHLTRLLPNSHRVELAAGGHNVLGADCTRSLRNAWLAGNVDDAPPSDPCLTAPPDFT